MKPKLCTDLEQSKKLEEILPIESADMYYHNRVNIPDNFPLPIEWKHSNPLLSQEIPCWSLVALLNVLPFHVIVDNQRYSFSAIKGLDKNGETYAIKYTIFNTPFYFHLTDFYSNPVDACVEMIIQLKNKNLL